MSAGHTPGPWVVRSGADGLPDVRDGGGEPVAQIAWVPETGSQQTLANARLIARAPDLLAENGRLRVLLVRAVDKLDRGISIHGDDAIAGDLRAALSEQEGK